MAVCGGKEHTVILDGSGNIFVFGSNEYSQIPHNAFTTRPLLVPGVENIVSISCGDHFTVCVDGSGVVSCFGFSTSRFNMDVAQDNLPNIYVQTLLKDIQQISCGLTYTLCIDSNHQVFGFGMLFPGLNVNISTNWKTTLFPVPKIPEKVHKISCGKYYCLFLTVQGDCYGWGSTLVPSQCTVDTPAYCKPTKLESLQDIVDMDTGYYHSLLYDSEGTIYGIGRDTRISKEENPIIQFAIYTFDIPDSIIPASVSCGKSFSMILDKEYNVWFQGYEESLSGELPSSNTFQILKENIGLISHIPNRVILKSISGEVYSHLTDNCATFASPGPIIDNSTKWGKKYCSIIDIPVISTSKSARFI